MESENIDTFTERMLKRASTKTLLRRQKILQALDNNNYEIQPIIVTHTDRNSLVSSLSTAINNLQQQIDALEIEKSPKTLEKNGDNQINIYPTLSGVREMKKINFETIKINDEVEEIGETPKPRRRGYYRPNMESTRASLITTSNPDPMTSTETKSSMQVESTISTIPMIGEGSRDDRIPYEVERFLEDALGDEMNNTTVTYGGQSDGRDRTNSHFNASELISEDRSPFYKRISKFWNHEKRDVSYTEELFTKGVRDSSTLDKSMMLYRSLSQRIKKKIRAALTRDHPQSPPIVGTSLQPLSFDKDRMDQLENILKHMKIQQCIIHQANKALNLCHTSKEFLGSLEQIESERLLLLAEIRKNLLNEQLKRLSNTSEDLFDENDKFSDITECAEVTIENINLSLRECLRRVPLPGESIDWFIIVIIEGTNVWASLPAPRPIDSMILEIPNFLCTIDNLKPNFKIIIQIYCLKLKSGIVLNHEDKYHINNSKMDETFICPSPTRFLKRMEKSSPKVQIHQGIFSSSFVKSGEMELGLHDLALSSPWALTGLPHGSYLLGTVDVNLSCKLHLSIYHQGFLNYGEDSGGFVTWNRRWCVLKGNMLMFWNYPREQEGKDPLRKIDLVHCTDERIEEVRRELCAKPRTIIVETVRVREVGDMDSILVNCRQSYTVQRHLLSYDSKKDVNEWKIKLNHVISALREWNVTFMKDAPKSPMVSEL